MLFVVAFDFGLDFGLVPFVMAFDFVTTSPAFPETPVSLPSLLFAKALDYYCKYTMARIYNVFSQKSKKKIYDGQISQQPVKNNWNVKMQRSLDKK